MVAPTAAFFIQLRIDVKPVPESLQDVKYQARATVQEPQAEYISVEKVEQPADEEGAAVVEAKLQPSGTIHLGRQQSRRDSVSFLDPRKNLADFACRGLQMLF